MDTVNYVKKDIKDMNVMELIEEITETTKIAALNLWGTNRERTNIAIDECAQKMKNIRLKADKTRLSEAFDNITSFRNSKRNHRLESDLEKRSRYCKRNA